MKYLLIGLLRIIYIIIVSPILALGLIVEVVALFGGYPGGKYPVISNILFGWWYKKGGIKI